MLNGKKTYLAALGALLGAVGGVLTGALSIADAAQIAITAVLGATLRNGMNGSPTK